MLLSKHLLTYMPIAHNHERTVLAGQWRKARDGGVRPSFCQVSLTILRILILSNVFLSFSCMCFTFIGELVPVLRLSPPLEFRCVQLESSYSRSYLHFSRKTGIERGLRMSNVQVPTPLGRRCLRRLRHLKLRQLINFELTNMAPSILPSTTTSFGYLWIMRLHASSQGNLSPGKHVNLFLLCCLMRRASGLPSRHQGRVGVLVLLVGVWGFESDSRFVQGR